MLIHVCNYQDAVPSCQQVFDCRAKHNPDMETSRHRLKSARLARGYTQEELATAVGCGQSTIGNLESSGNSKSQTTSKWLPKIADVLDVPVLWLTDDKYAGCDPLASDVVKSQSVMAEVHHPVENVLVPILENHVTGGSGSEFLDVDVLAGNLSISREWAQRTLVPLPRDIRRLRVVHAKGDSMKPTIGPGNVLLVDTGHITPDIDGIYVLRADGQLFVKRVSREPGMAPVISSDNPAHKTVTSLDGTREIDIVGRVLYVFRGDAL